MVQPQDFAKGVTFLSSDEASATTGVNFPVDCGWLVPAPGIPTAAGGRRELNGVQPLMVLLLRPTDRAGGEPSPIEVYQEWRHRDRCRQVKNGLHQTSLALLPRASTLARRQKCKSNNRCAA